MLDYQSGMENGIEMSAYKPEILFLDLEQLNQRALKLDGYDECIIGIAYDQKRGHLIAYSQEKIINTLMKRDGMSNEDAVDYFDYNIADAWMGDGTPIIIQTEEI